MGMRMKMDLDTSQTDRWRFLVIYWNSIRFFFYLFTNSDSFSIARIAALKASITSRYYHIGFISHTLFLQKRFLFVLWNHFCKMLSLLRRIWFIFVVVAQRFQTKQNIQCYRRNIQSNMETKRNYIQYLFVIYWLCEFRERTEKKNAKFCNQDRFHESFSLYFVFRPHTVQTLLMIAATQSILRCHRSAKYFRFATIYLTFICRLSNFFFFTSIFSLVWVNIQSQQCKTLGKTLLKSALRCQNHGRKM